MIAFLICYFVASVLATGWLLAAFQLNRRMPTPPFSRPSEEEDSVKCGLDSSARQGSKTVAGDPLAKP